VASNGLTFIAITAVLIGGLILSRKAAANEFGGDDLEEIKVTANRIGEGSILEHVFNGNVPLGIRNNNPMNVRETAIDWLGELPHDGDGYEDFDHAGNGIRAGARVLLNYFRQHGIRTIEGIIMRWAPPSDNNPTGSYIEFVAKRMGAPQNAPLDMENVGVIAALAEAIIEFENGKQPYTRAYIREHVARAF